MPRDQGGDSRRIQPSAEIGSDRHIGAKADSRRVHEQGHDLLADFAGEDPANKNRADDRGYPNIDEVAALRGDGRRHARVWSSLNIVENCYARKGRPEGEDLIEGPRIQGRRRNELRGDQGLDLGGEEKVAVMLGKVQGTDPEMVPGEKKGFFVAVPDAEGELPVEIIDTIRALFLIEMNDDFGIRVRIEPMPSGLQPRPQFREVINLPVQDDPDRLVFVVDGLGAARRGR